MRNWKFISGIVLACGEGALQMSDFTCVPLAILLGITAIGLLGWSAWPIIQRKILLRLSHKQRIISACSLAVVIIVIVLVVLNMGHINDGETTPIPTPTTLPASSEDWQWSHPSPQEIFAEINHLPVSLQEEARQNYKGLSVTWAVSLFSMTNYPDGERIYSNPVAQVSALPGVFFTIDINDYPQLKIAKRGQEFIVQGTIISVDSLNIELGNCHLNF
jgi:hypothetical protein